MALNSRKTIVDFDNEISIDDSIQVHLVDDLLDVTDLTLIKSIMDIISKYKQKDWLQDMSVTEMNSDLMNLQAYQVTAMHRFSTLNSYADSVEERIKLIRAKVRINIKAKKTDFEKQGDTVAITAEEAKDLSYSKTENLWNRLQEIKATSDFLKSLYFSVKDHVFMLNHTIHRYSRFE